jgi:hypothetical protein
MNSKIQTIVTNRKATYSKSLNTFSAWSTKKSSANGASDKYIRNMLSQMLKELRLPSTKVNSIINSLFMRDFGADKLVNNVWKNPGVFDIISKDPVIRQKTIENYLNALKVSGLHMTGYDAVQLAGLCVFTQFILGGGRTELEGFGVSSNLIEKRKKIIKGRKLSEKKNNNVTIVPSIITAFEPDEEKTEEKLEQIDVPDSWEDL